MMTPSRTSRYLAGLSSGYLVTFVIIAVGLWLTPFTLRFLDREEYAIFALVGDILVWLNLLDLGITGSLRVQAAQLTGCSDQENMNRLASTAFFTQVVVVSLVVLVGIVIVFVFPTIFRVRQDLQYQSMQVLGLMLFSTALTMGTQTFSALLVAHQQIHIDNLIRLVLIALRTFITVILLVLGWKLLSLAMASVIATMITAGLSIFRVRRLLPALAIRFRLVSWNLLRSLGKLGIWFSLGALAGIVIESLDRVMAARLVSLESVTTLSLTGRVYVLGGSLLAQITNTARPALGQLLGQKKFEETYRSYRHIFVLSSGGAVVVALSLWAGNGCFVTWWVGPQNYGGGLLDLALALNLIVHAWVLPNRAILAAGLIVRPQTTSRIIEGTLNFGLAILLGKYFGLLGIVISTGIAGIITSCWYLPWLTARLFKLNYIKYLFEEVGRLILVAILLAPVAWAVRYFLSYDNIVSIMLSMGLVFVIGTLLLIIITFDRSLRTYLYNKLIFPFRALLEKTA